MRKAAVLWAFFVVHAISIISCTSVPKPVKGTIEIRFHLNSAEGVEPSYQTVVWLEDEAGTYLKSFLVSEYLAYGGFNDSTICPAWSKNANWDQTPEEVFDAVTRATPPVGETILQIDCLKENLFPGTYNFLIQTHIVAKYSILAKGNLVLGKEKFASNVERFYIPSVYVNTAQVLDSVSAEFIPKK